MYVCRFTEEAEKRGKHVHMYSFCRCVVSQYASHRLTHLRMMSRHHALHIYRSIRPHITFCNIYVKLWYLKIRAGHCIWYNILSALFLFCVRNVFWLPGPFVLWHGINNDAFSSIRYTHTQTHTHLHSTHTHAFRVQHRNNR